MWSRQLARYSDFAPVILRLTLGIIFIAHGWMKVQDVAGTAGFFASVGIPMATLMAYIVTAVEFGGGLTVLLGIFTRYAAALIAVVMLVAILNVKVSLGLVGGYELDLALLGSALALMLLGPGSMSLEKALWKREM